MKKLADFYFERKVKVHISLDSGIFFNGMIIKVGSDFIILNDIKLGETMIIASNIKDEGIIPFTEEKK